MASGEVRAGIGAGAGKRALGRLVSIHDANVGFLDLRIGLSIVIRARAGHLFRRGFWIFHFPFNIVEELNDISTVRSIISAIE